MKDYTPVKGYTVEGSKYETTVLRAIVVLGIIGVVIGIIAIYKVGGCCVFT